MPYSRKRYGTKKQYKKYRRCVRKVRVKSKKVNPYAVCRASVYGKKKQNSPKVFVDRGGDKKYRIYVSSPFGHGLAEQLRGTRAFKTHKSAMEKLAEVI